ncbi:hypothetical protein [uncultured Flavobacterium sp.]|uniref:hypothetical protein n=1 Tax=uncultured Flavobacterium sp. TaxID=165435 RepID=UPI0030C8A629
MIAKKTIYLGLSVLVFITTMFSILLSDIPNGNLNESIAIHWIILFVFALLLPIFNLAEIIINRDDWNKFYWIGLVLNIITFIFISRYFNIDINVFAELFN